MISAIFLTRGNSFSDYGNNQRRGEESSLPGINLTRRNDTGGEKLKTRGECVVSVFWFSRYSDLPGTPVETNGSRDQWLAALAGNYELLPRERGMAGLIRGRADRKSVV